jgi:hypothetical protein
MRVMKTGPLKWANHLGLSPPFSLSGRNIRVLQDKIRVDY